MTETQKELERLRTLQETSDFWADVAEKQLPLLSKESTLQEESAAIQSKIDNIKLPEIYTTELAKQGENPEATMSKVYDAVKALPDLSLLYAARAEKNDDGENTYSIVLPVTAKAILDKNGVATIQL